MPTPVAKGIIIGVAALVAAGIAVYESPQFRRWVNNSRRKLAMTLHNLGDDIHPGDGDSRYRNDISMTEEIGPAADERRRIAREEISRRRSILEERRKKRSNSSLGTFDALVDENGRLLDLEDQGNPAANSTALDLGVSQPTHRGHQSDTPAAQSTVLFEAEPAPEQSKLQLSIPAPRSRASSVAGADFTPVSDVSEVMASAVSQQSGDSARPRSSASSHTEGAFSEVIYAHPDSMASGHAEDSRSPFSDLEGLRFPRSRPVTPPTPSTTDNFSHIAVDASSDGVLSEFEGSIGRVVTPASWSEVGSDVSSDEYRHRGF
ncbi:hypothetical protein BDV09DRAFT_192294 [Aspergillus tetrazonus]